MCPHDYCYVRRCTVGVFIIRLVRSSPVHLIFVFFCELVLRGWLGGLSVAAVKKNIYF